MIHCGRTEVLSRSAVYYVEIRGDLERTPGARSTGSRAASDIFLFHAIGQLGGTSAVRAFRLFDFFPWQFTRHLLS